MITALNDVDTRNLVDSVVGGFARSAGVLAEHLQTIGQVVKALAAAGAVYAAIRVHLVAVNLVQTRAIPLLTGAAAAWTALAGSMGAAAAAGRAASIAVRGLGAALRFLGGPLGVILLALEGLLVYRTFFADVKEHAESVDRLAAAKKEVLDIDGQLARAAGSNEEALRREREERVRGIRTLLAEAEARESVARAALGASRRADPDRPVGRASRDLAQQLNALRAERGLEPLSFAPGALDSPETKRLLRDYEIVEKEAAEIRAALAALEESGAAARAAREDARAAQVNRQTARTTARLEQELALIGRTAREVAILTALRQAGSDALIEQGQALDDHVAGLSAKHQQVARLQGQLFDEHAARDAAKAAAVQQERAISRVRAAREAQQATLGRAVEDMRREIDLMGRSAEAQAVLTALREAGVDVGETQGQTLAAIVRSLDAEGRKVAVLAAELYRLGQAREADTEAAREAQKVALLADSESPLDGVREGLRRFTADTRSAAQEWADVTESAARRMSASIAEFVRGGKVEFRGLVDYVIQESVRLSVVDPLIRGLLGAVSNWLAPSFSFPANPNLAPPSGVIAHAGGIVGEGALRWPRYHAGGLASDEVPAILRRREGVFTPEQMAALAPVGSAAPQVTVEVINQGPPLQVEQTEQRIEAGRAVVSVVVADVRRRGELAQAMEAHYGLRPVVG